MTIPPLQCGWTCNVKYYVIKYVVIVFLLWIKLSKIFKKKKKKTLAYGWSICEKTPLKPKYGENERWHNLTTIPLTLVGPKESTLNLSNKELTLIPQPILWLA